MAIAALATMARDVSGTASRAFRKAFVTGPLPLGARVRLASGSVMMLMELLWTIKIDRATYTMRAPQQNSQTPKFRPKTRHTPLKYQRVFASFFKKKSFLPCFI
jgi:hypothetical protein